MTATLAISVRSDETQALLQQLLKPDATKDREAALALSRYFKDLAAKRTRGNFDVQTGAAVPARASATWTIASVIATDACTIGGITFTFTSTPTLETDVEVDGADDTADALALANAVNAHSTVGKQVLASASGAVVTITSRVAGVIGNMIAISDADSTITTSSTYLLGGTGGAQDAQASFACGL